MNEASVTQYITDTFEGVELVVADGNTFFFDSADHKFPFATLVTNNLYDQFSELSRPSVFRLNIEVSKETYRTLFDSESSHDFTALGKLMPHPIYGTMHWVCILNPSNETFEKTVRPLLTEAYERAVAKRRKTSSTE